VPLARLIFRAPTQYYKTGVVFLAWLNGFQDHFVMLGGAQSMRPLPYFIEVFKTGRWLRIAARAGTCCYADEEAAAVYGV
jgi:membrane protein YqaA with SNARE-associated domain